MTLPGPPTKLRGFLLGSYFLCRCADVFTNKKNGHAVMVTITDRGPYIKGRCIDLSKAGARALGFAGLAPVSVVPVVSD
jgi:rare lipoprotein A